MGVWLAQLSKLYALEGRQMAKVGFRLWKNGIQAAGWLFGWVGVVRRFGDLRNRLFCFDLVMA